MSPPAAGASGRCRIKRGMLAPPVAFVGQVQTLIREWAAVRLEKGLGWAD